MAAVAVLALAPRASHGAPWASSRVGPGDAAPAIEVSLCLGGDRDVLAGGAAATLVSWWDPLEPRSRELERVVRLAASLGDVAVLALCGERPAITFEVARASVPAWADEGPVAFGWDDGSRTRRAFLGAREEDGADQAVLIDAAGRVAWVGEVARMAEPLQAVHEGSWDLELGATRMSSFERRRARASERAHDEPLAALDELSALADEFPRLRSVTLHQRYLLASRVGRHDLARELGRRLVDEAYAEGRAFELVLFARNLVEPSQAREERYLDLAHEAAEHAVELTSGSCGHSLACLARVRWWRRDLEEAVALQERAVAATSGRDHARFARTLDEYRGVALVPAAELGD